MTSTEFNIPPKATPRQTTSFGTHRMSDRPASAISAGASSMPASWQTQNKGRMRGGLMTPERPLIDVILGPVAWALAAPRRKWMGLFLLGALGYALIF